MPSIRRSLVLSFAQKYTGLLITVPSIMVISRLLTPSEIGVFSVAMALTALIHTLRAFGVAEYLVQERHLTREKIRAAFTVTWLLAWVIAAVLFFSSNEIASFYSEAGIGDVLRVLALSFLVFPFGSPVTALLQRELKYGSLYLINTAASVASAGVSIGMAVAGFSYMSLAWGALAGVTVTAIGATLCRPGETWLLPGLSEWRRVASFGAKQTFAAVLRELGRDANDIVIGRMLGFAAAGFFSRGNGLINMFETNIIAAVSQVAGPAFASYVRADADVSWLYVKALSYLTGLAWPFYLFAALMARPIILFAFGPQWLPAVPVLRILAVAGLVTTLSQIAGHVLVVSGHINANVRAQTIAQPLRIGLIIWASFYSIEAVAAAQIAAGLIMVGAQHRELRKHLNLSLSKVLKNCQSSAIVAAATAIAPATAYMLHQQGVLQHLWLILLIACMGAGIGWITAVALVRHPLGDELASAWRNANMRRCRA